LQVLLINAALFCPLQSAFAGDGIVDSSMSVERSSHAHAASAAHRLFTHVSKHKHRHASVVRLHGHIQHLLGQLQRRESRASFHRHFRLVKETFFIAEQFMGGREARFLFESLEVIINDLG